jgi:hypothetical protein
MDGEDEGRKGKGGRRSNAGGGRKGEGDEIGEEERGKVRRRTAAHRRR